MNSGPGSKPAPGNRLRNFLIAFLVVAGTMSFLFSASFRPEQVLFSNDGPLGICYADANSLPKLFSGYWLDLYWVGQYAGRAPPDIPYLLFWVLGPLYLAKFYASIALLISG